MLHEYLVGKGHSAAYLAARIGCSRQSVSKYAELFGIPVPSNKPEDHRGNVSYGRRKVNGVVIDHLGEQRVVHRILELREQGFPYSKIADYLNKMGVPTKKTGNKWFAMSVRRVVEKFKK